MTMLEGLGCAVTVVDNGRLAFEAIEQSAFDLVFMDCQMAGMNGYDATRAIRASEEGDQHVTIVALTANVLPEERELCMSVGMDDYLSKPFSFKDIHTILERWL